MQKVVRFSRAEIVQETLQTVLPSVIVHYTVISGENVHLFSIGKSFKLVIWR